jgi:hypothetical protein
LFESGYDKINNSITLVAYTGATVAGVTNLFIKAPSINNGTIPLYISGPGKTQEGVNLFLQALPPYQINQHIPLLVRGAAVGGVNAMRQLYAPLYMGPSPIPSETLNLYLHAISAQGKVFSPLDLFIRSDTPKIARSIPLFVQNNQQENSGTLYLSVSGLGKNPGYVPISEQVNLFIGASGGGSPYASPVSINSLIPLYTSGGIQALVGANSTENAIPLYLMTSPANVLSMSSNLYMSGGVPPSMNSTVSLVIPKTYMQLITNLYMHGF